MRNELCLDSSTLIKAIFHKFYLYFKPQIILAMTIIAALLLVIVGFGIGCALTARRYDKTVDELQSENISLRYDIRYFEEQYGITEQAEPDQDTLDEWSAQDQEGLDYDANQRNHEIETLKNQSI